MCPLSYCGGSDPEGRCGSAGPAVIERESADQIARGSRVRGSKAWCRYWPVGGRPRTGSVRAELSAGSSRRERTKSSGRVFRAAPGRRDHPSDGRDRPASNREGIIPLGGEGEDGVAGETLLGGKGLPRGAGKGAQGRCRPFLPRWSFLPGKNCVNHIAGQAVGGGEGGEASPRAAQEGRRHRCRATGFPRDPHRRFSTAAAPLRACRVSNWPFA